MIKLGINSAVSEIIDIDFSSKYLITPVQHSFLFFFLRENYCFV